LKAGLVTDRCRRRWDGNSAVGFEADDGMARERRDESV